MSHQARSITSNLHNKQSSSNLSQQTTNERHDVQCVRIYRLLQQRKKSNNMYVPIQRKCKCVMIKIAAQRVLTSWANLGTILYCFLLLMTPLFPLLSSPLIKGGSNAKTAIIANTNKRTQQKQKQRLPIENQTTEHMKRASTL